jgi:hypothetical protein
MAYLHLERLTLVNIRFMVNDNHHYRTFARVMDVRPG